MQSDTALEPGATRARARVWPRLLAMLTRLVALALYVGALAWSYRDVVAPRYAYMGLVWNPNREKVLAAGAFLLVAGLLVSHPRNLAARLGDLFVLLSVVPIAVFFALSDAPWGYAGIVAGAVAMLVLLVRAGGWLIHRREGRERVQPARPPRYLVWALTLAGLAATVALVLLSGGLDLRTLSFNNVYKVRRSRNVGTLGIFLLHWTSKVLLPTALVLAAWHRRWIAFLAAAGGLGLVYMATGHKSVVLVLPLLVALMLFTSWRWWWEAVCGLFAVAIAASSFATLATGKAMFVLIGVVRIMLMPAEISYSYYEFFSTFPQLRYCESFIGRVTGNSCPYFEPAAKLLSPDGKSNYNTGVLGDGYANAGTLGVLAAVAGVGLFLLLVERITRDDQRRQMFLVMLAYPVVVWNDLPFLTSLVTGGLLLQVALVALIVALARRGRGPQRALPARVPDHFLGRHRHLPARAAEPSALATTVATVDDDASADGDELSVDPEPASPAAAARRALAEPSQALVSGSGASRAVRESESSPAADED